MTTVLQEAEDLLSKMSRGEKAQLLQWVVRDLGGNAYPGIEQSPKVLGGQARIVRTRIPIWTIVLAKQSGATDAKILETYPSLTAEDLANAWAFYRNHKTEIDLAINENKVA